MQSNRSNNSLPESELCKPSSENKILSVIDGSERELSPIEIFNKLLEKYPEWIFMFEREKD